MSRHPDPIAAAGRAAPPARVIFGSIVEEGSASRTGAPLNQRKVRVTEQIAGRLSDRHQQLIGLAWIEAGHLLQSSRTPCQQPAARTLSHRPIDRFEWFARGFRAIRALFV